MKPEPSDSRTWPVVPVILVRHLPAEEAVEEVLEVVRTLPLLLILVLIVVAAARLLRHRLNPAVKLAPGSCRWTAWAASAVLMFTTAGPTSWQSSQTRSAGTVELTTFERSGVGAGVLLLLLRELRVRQRNRPRWRPRAWQAGQTLKRDGANAAVLRAISWVR